MHEYLADNEEHWLGSLDPLGANGYLGVNSAAVGPPLALRCSRIRNSVVSEAASLTTDWHIRNAVGIHYA